MPKLEAVQIDLSNSEREELEQLLRRTTTPQQIALRAKISPISHWSARELALELIKQGIVESISERHVGRLLKEADLKPYQSNYWLNPPPDHQFKPKVEDICQVYELAQARALEGEVTLSLDEMTGIQALERTMPDIPLS